MSIRNLVKLEFDIIHKLFSYKSNILPIGSYLLSPLITYKYNVFFSLNALYINNILFNQFTTSFNFLNHTFDKYEIYFIIFYGFAINLLKTGLGFM